VALGRRPTRFVTLLVPFAERFERLDDALPALFVADDRVGGVDHRSVQVPAA